MIKKQLIFISFLMLAMLVGTVFASPTVANTTTNVTAVSSNSILTTSQTVNYSQALSVFNLVAAPLKTIILYTTIVLFFILEFGGLIILFNNQIKRADETGANINVSELLRYAFFAGLILLIPFVFNIFTYGFPAFLTVFGKVSFEINPIIISAVLLISAVFSFIGYFLFLKAYLEDVGKYLSNKSKQISYRRESVLFIGLVLAPFIIAFIFLLMTEMLATASLTATSSFANVTVNNSASSYSIATAVYQAPVNACPNSPALWQIGQEIECSAESGYYYFARSLYPFAIQAGEYSFTTSLTVNSFASNVFTTDIYSILFPFILIWVFAWIDYLSYDYFKSIDTEKEEVAFKKLKSKIKQYVLFIFSPLIFIIFVFILAAISHILIAILFSSSYSPIPAIFRIVSIETVLNPVVFVTGYIGIIFAGLLLIVVALFSLIQMLAGPLFILATYLFGSEKPHIQSFGKRIYYVIAALFIIPMIFVFVYSLWFGLLPGIIYSAIGSGGTITTGTVYGYTITGSGASGILNGPGISSLAFTCNSNPSIAGAISQITASTSSANQADAFGALGYACGNFINGWASGILIIDLISVAIIVAIILLMHFAPAVLSGVPGLGSISTAFSGKSFMEGMGTVSEGLVKSISDKKGIVRSSIRGVYGYTKAPLAGTTEGAVLEGTVGTAMAVGGSIANGINNSIETKQKDRARNKILDEAKQSALESMISHLDPKNAEKILSDYNAHPELYEDMFNEDGTINKLKAPEILKDRINSLIYKKKKGGGDYNKYMEKRFGKNDSILNDDIDIANETIKATVQLGSENRKGLNPGRINEMYNAIEDTKKGIQNFNRIGEKVSYINNKYDNENEKVKNDKSLSTTQIRSNIAENEEKRKEEINKEIYDSTTNMNSAFASAKEVFPESMTLNSSLLGNSTPQEMVENFKSILDGIDSYKSIAVSSKLKTDDKEKLNNEFSKMQSVFDQEAKYYGFKDAKDLVQSSDGLTSIKTSSLLNNIKNSNEKDKEEKIKNFMQYMKEIGMKQDSMNGIENLLSSNNSNNLIEGLQKTMFDNLNGTSKEISASIEEAFAGMSNPLFAKVVSIKKGISGNIDENIKAMIQNPLNTTLKTQIDAIKKVVNETWYQVSSGTITDVISRIANENENLAGEISIGTEKIKDYQKGLLNKDISEKEKNELKEKIEELQLAISDKKLKIISNNKSADLYNKIPAITGIIDAISEFNVESSDDVVKRYKFRSKFIQNQEDTNEKESSDIENILKDLKSKYSKERNELAKAYLTEQIDRQNEKLEKLKLSSTTLNMQKSAIDSFLTTADMQNIDEKANEEMQKLKEKEMLNEAIKKLTFEDKETVLNKINNDYNEIMRNYSKIEDLKSDLNKNKVKDASLYKELMSNPITKLLYNNVENGIKMKSEVEINKALNKAFDGTELEKMLINYYESKDSFELINSRIEKIKTDLFKEKNEENKIKMTNEISDLTKSKNELGHDLEQADSKIEVKIKNEIQGIPDESIDDIKKSIFGLNILNKNSKEEYEKEVKDKVKNELKPYISEIRENEFKKNLNVKIDNTIKTYDKLIQNKKQEFADNVNKNISEIISMKSSDPELEKDRVKLYNEIKDMPYSTEAEVKEISKKIESFKDTNEFANFLIESLENIKTNLVEDKDVVLTNAINSGIVMNSDEIEKQTELINKFKERVKEIEKKRIKIEKGQDSDNSIKRASK